MWWLVGLIGVYVIWKVSAFLAEHPPKVRLPKVTLPELRLPAWVTEETPADRYRKVLGRIRSLPLNEEERDLLLEEARIQYIEDVKKTYVTDAVR